MSRERLHLIAEQVLGGKKLHEIDFGEPKLDLEEKLRRIDQAIRQIYPCLKRWPKPRKTPGSAARAINIAGGHSV